MVGESLTLDTIMCLFLTSQFWAITIVCPVLLHSMLRREDRIETMMDVLRNFRDMSSSSDWGGKNDVSVGALRQMFAIETLFHEPSYFIVLFCLSSFYMRV